MKTDVFTLTFVFAIVIAVISGGIVILIAQNNLTDIPLTERGTIVSKTVINTNDSVIGLSNGRILHILNNPPLYQSLQQNQSYIFNCRFNYNTKIIVIEDAKNETTVLS
jgi:hypothetical protein